MAIVISPTLVVEEDEIDERFIRASGPGGQNVNKVATAVQLRFDIGRSALPEEVKVRLRRMAGARLTADDVLVVEAREHRTQGRNREAARTRLQALVLRAARRPKSRRPTRPTRASTERRLEQKKQRGERKRSRQDPGGD